MKVTARPISYVKPRCFASPARLAAAKRRSVAQARRKWGPHVELFDFADLSREMIRKFGPSPSNFRRPSQSR